MSDEHKQNFTSSDFLALPIRYFDAQMNAMIEHQLATLKDLIEVGLLEYTTKPWNIELGVRNSREFNAGCAPGDDSHEYVYVNAGAYVWADIIGGILAITGQKDKAGEAMRRRPFSLDVGEYEKDDPQETKDALSVLSRVTADKDYAVQIVRYLTYVLWLHELSHSIMGHVDYLKDTKGASPHFQEIPRGETLCFVDSDTTERKYLEMEADWHAGFLAALLISQVTEERDRLSEVTMYVFCFAIIATAFAGRLGHTPTSDCCYPSPYCRLQIFFGGMQIPVKDGETVKPLISTEDWLKGMQLSRCTKA